MFIIQTNKRKTFILTNISYIVSPLIWAGHVARMGERKRRIQGFGGGNLRERGHLGDPIVDGRIIEDGYSGSGMWGYGLDRAGSG